MIQTALKLGRSNHGVRLSQAEFAEAHFDKPWWYERVKGRLIVMPPCGSDHQYPNSRFHAHLAAYWLKRPDIVEQVISEAWMQIDDETDRIADVGVYLVGNRRGKLPLRPPDIAVEIVSEDTTSYERDYSAKRSEYERAGVREYVVVDRFDRRVTVFRRHRGRFQESVLEDDEVYTSPLLPGLKISLKFVFG
jgi:Uma2 family endonuclease